MSRPTVRTQRLVLEPMSWDHLDDLCELDADPEVMRFLGAPRTADEVRAKMPDRLSPSDDALGLGFWCGFERGMFVGWWCLSLEGPELAEIGWRLHRRAWGRGLATEAAAALLEHGFETVGLERIIAETLAVNLASRGVMRKLGMTHESTEPIGPNEPEATLPGAAEGMVRYEIIRERWASG
ncbi:MAG TPA: GNAT family N-acetyltransferase, partial [Phycicoccus sp.]|nr:GNAT family N-acetyltransferase [Phycicoccus sp.]